MMTKHRTAATVGYYIGGMKEEELKKEGKKQDSDICYGRRRADIKTLTTLIMSLPK